LTVNCTASGTFPDFGVPVKVATTTCPAWVTVIQLVLVSISLPKAVDTIRVSIYVPAAVY